MEENIIFFDASIMYAVQPPIYEELLKQERTSVTGSKCERRVNDCYLLLNQNRLDKQTQEVILEQIEHSIGSTGLSDLRNKYTDDQLCDFVKSKHIQSKSELHDYMLYLMHKEKQEKVEMSFKNQLNQQMKNQEKENEKETKTD